VPGWRKPPRIAETAGALLARGMKSLEGTSDSPRADALLLLSKAIRRRREWIVANAEAETSKEEVEQFLTYCSRRAGGLPVAYILGSAHFYGREFLVNESVLVPRPETEHLVDETLRFMGERSFHVLDIGTGSGAIACTIAAQTGSTVDATDISGGALEVATENARRFDVSDRCRFFQGNLAEPVRTERYDVVVANLPYVPTKDLPRSPEPASFEPRIALDGGPTGLRLYEELLPELPPIINPGAMLLFECAAPTIRQLTELVRTTFPNFVIEGCNDYAGLPRYIKALDGRTECEACA
jgi:release factor glutamine methyltransferase